MSAVKNKNNIKYEQPTTINKEQLRPHISENIGLTEQQKTVIGRDRSTPSFKFQVSSFICHIHDYTEIV